VFCVGVGAEFVMQQMVQRWLLYRKYAGSWNNVLSSSFSWLAVVTSISKFCVLRSCSAVISAYLWVKCGRCRKFKTALSVVTDATWPAQAHRIITPQEIVVAEFVEGETAALWPIKWSLYWTTVIFQLTVSPTTCHSYT